MDEIKQREIEEIARLQELLMLLDADTEEYKKTHEELDKHTRRLCEITKIENDYLLGSWKQSSNDRAAIREYIELGVQSAVGLGVALMTVFADETRRVCSAVGTALQNAFRFKKR